MKSTAIRIAIAAAALAAMAAPAAAESALGETYDGTHMAAGPNRAYEANPALSAATVEKRKNGYWGGPYGNVWITLSKEEISDLEKRRRNNQAYIVNPPLSDAAIEKRKNGYWGGPYGNVWVMPSHAEVASLEKRRRGRNIGQWSNN